MTGRRAAPGSGVVMSIGGHPAGHPLGGTGAGGWDILRCSVSEPCLHEGKTPQFGAGSTLSWWRRGSNRVGGANQLLPSSGGLVAAGVFVIRLGLGIRAATSLDRFLDCLGNRGFHRSLAFEVAVLGQPGELSRRVSGPCGTAQPPAGSWLAHRRTVHVPVVVPFTVPVTSWHGVRPP